MGREARRVPLDFDWPQGQVWHGYRMPDKFDEPRCPDCRYGCTSAGDFLQKVAYVICGLADDARDEERDRPMHPWLEPLRDISYGGYSDDARPGAEFAEFADGIRSDAGGFFGRDVYGMHNALIAAAGLPERWGVCPTCEGHASLEAYVGQRAEAEQWKPTEPPTGNGWQMWETTSEGGPDSPVFATPEELARWCVTGTTVFGSSRGTYDQWLAIITGREIAHVQIAPGVIAL